MINVSGHLLTDLYTRTILSEIFPECCFSYTNNIDCEVTVSEEISGVKVIANISNQTFSAYEKYCNHLNNRLAITTAIGTAIISYGRTKGVTPPPYGVLTGVRPFKIAIDLLSRYDYDTVIDKLKNVYLVSEDKIDLLLNTSMHDQKIRMSHKKNDVSIYISIPFCPTRCNYCSFISSSAPSQLQLIDKYLDELKKEISAVADLIEKSSLNLKSIYIGGGTPTILNSDQLETLLSHIDSTLSSGNLVEFTLEAGRPDTITLDKLDVIKKHGVSRTCVNCQTTNDDVLKAIGRQHSAEDFFNAFEMVKEYNFETINTDIIAGLNTDTFESFKKTVNDVLSLSPESITVHTLSVKKSSNIRLNERIEVIKDIDEYVAYSKAACIIEGYLPYYLYKQKYSVGNHENVGYCLHSHECYYNIAMMNEIEHIIGIGAGATSRLIGCNTNGKIEHFANYKYPIEYIASQEKYFNNLVAMEEKLIKR